MRNKNEVYEQGSSVEAGVLNKVQKLIFFLLAILQVILSMSGQTKINTL